MKPIPAGVNQTDTAEGRRALGVGEQGHRLPRLDSNRSEVDEEWAASLRFPMRIAETHCVITGASTGIGFAIAERLGERGARLVICGRNAAKLAEAVKRLEGEGIRVAGHTCDVGDPSQVERFATAAHDHLGRVDVLINNAGFGHFAPVADTSVEIFDQIMAANVRGVFLMTRAFLPEMLERQSGHIVNIASLAGKNGVPNGAAYSASKHAVIGFSRSLMLEVRKQGVRVIAVCPGSVATPFFDRAGAPRDDHDKLLQPKDVADAVVGALELPKRALISELDIRPANP